MMNEQAPERLAALSAEQRKSLLRKWMNERTEQPTSHIPVNAKEGPLPLTFAQERIWFLQQLSPHSPGYNLPIALRLKGPVRLDLLEQCFCALAQRYSTLRTTFVEIDNTPAQLIHSIFQFAIEIVDLQAVPEDKQEVHLSDQVTLASRRLFDLSNGPLWRAHVFILSQQEVLLLVTIHHLITDGWSNGLLIRELGQLYTCYMSGQEAPLKPLAVEYADFAIWQRNRFMEGVYEADRLYWMKRLADAPSVLQFPGARPRPAVQSFASGMHHVSVPSRIMAALQRICQQERATAVMAHLAILNLLLWRYTDQTDILIGLPIFNRHDKDAEALIGLFVNTLVIRTTNGGNPSFRDTLRAIRSVMLESYEHQNYPFEKIVDDLHLARDTSHTPLFQILLSVGVKNDTSSYWGDVVVHSYKVQPPATNFDITVEMTEQTDGLHIDFIYCSDLFDAHTIQLLAEHYVRLFDAYSAAPDDDVTRIGVLSKTEQQYILLNYNDTNSDTTLATFLHHLVEKQVALSPDALAVVSGGQHLSYEQLNCRANQLAHHLCREGIGPEILVGLVMERSIELIVALLGILKAGGAYVPLDPDYPQERLLSILQDAHIPLILTQERYVSRIPQCSAKILCLDQAYKQLAQERSENVWRDIDSEQLAYVIYTSGSTGRPKGAMNTHRAISSHLLWMQQQYQLTSDDRVLQKTPYSFDVSVWELFWPLSSGACLVFAEPEGHRDPAYLIDVIKREQISVLHFVPSMLQSFLNEPGVEQCTSLRDVICSGEVLSIELQRRFFQHLSARLHNLYGPTEAAIDVTSWQCRQDPQNHSVPIGKPVANTQIYLLDRELQPVPPGVIGELYIGGVQLGRGYWQGAALTAERFIPHPFSTSAGVRLYKTGDLALYRHDGNIEYIRRIDTQVKLRGLRIELGEIEAALTEFPEISNAVVTLHTGKEERDTRIVAYYTRHPSEGQDSPLEAEALRSFLALVLPVYMLPDLFIILDSIPLLPSGKLDRAALPPPDLALRRTHKALILPTTNIERMLADIWQELLQIKQISIHDNFFELGGNSLLVVQMRGKLREQLQIELSIPDLFRFSTIRALALHIQQHRQPEAIEKTTVSLQKRAVLQRKAIMQQRSKKDIKRT